MKARVIETGEIIEVKSLYSPIYSRLDCNGKIISEYDEDELEFITNPNKPKMVNLEKIIEYLTPRLEADLGYYAAGDFINNLRKEFE
jgi:hypothetical protein